MIRIKDRLANWQRFQTILTVLGKHGFSGILHEIGFLSSQKKGADIAEDSIPRRLRLAFEELGPTFIKLGQLLSTRPDLLSEPYIQEFSKLTDQISSFPFSEVQKILETEFGRDYREIYETIEEKPMAAASISQVHRATLKDSGTRVVVKVQRPGIESVIQGDIQVLYFIANTLNKFRSDLRLLNLPAIVKEFHKSIYEELDFSLEARNIERFEENFPEVEGIRIPSVIWDFSTKKILTMTEMKGTPLSQIQHFPENVDRSFLTENLVTFFFESMFFHGLFHADAHSGNILVNTEDGKGELSLLDFGMVGTLSPQLRQKLSKLFMAVVSQDYEALAVAYVDIGEFGKSFSIKEFTADITDLLQPNLGKPLKEVNIGQLLLDSTRVARKYKVRLPRDLVMFYRSLVTLEHIGRKLDPEFEFLTYGQRFARTLVKRRYSSEEILRDLFKTVEGLRSLGTELPAHLRTLVKKMDRESFSFGNPPSDMNAKLLRKMTRQNHLSLLTITLLMSSTLVTTLRPDSLLLWPLWIVSGVLALSMAVSLLQEPRV